MASARLPKLAFSAVRLLEIFAVPVIFAPVAVTTKVVLPPETMLTLPLITGMLTLLVPLDTLPVAATFVKLLPSPLK